MLVNILHTFFRHRLSHNIITICKFTFFFGIGNFFYNKPRRFPLGKRRGWLF